MILRAFLAPHVPFFRLRMAAMAPPLRQTCNAHPEAPASWSEPLGIWGDTSAVRHAVVACGGQAPSKSHRAHNGGTTCANYNRHWHWFGNDMKWPKKKSALSGSLLDDHPYPRNAPRAETLGPPAFSDGFGGSVDGCHPAWPCWWFQQGHELRNFWLLDLVEHLPFLSTLILAPNSTELDFITVWYCLHLLLFYHVWITFHRTGSLLSHVQASPPQQRHHGNCSCQFSFWGQKWPVSPLI